MAGNPLASLPGLPQRPSLARSSASETRLTQPGIEAARSRKLNSAPTAAFRFIVGDDKWKYGWLAAQAERLARGLTGRGIRKGDRMWAMTTNDGEAKVRIQDFLEK